MKEFFNKKNYLASNNYEECIATLKIATTDELLNCINEEAMRLNSIQRSKNETPNCLNIKHAMIIFELAQRKEEIKINSKFYQKLLCKCLLSSSTDYTSYMTDCIMTPPMVCGENIYIHVKVAEALYHLLIANDSICSSDDWKYLYKNLYFAYNTACC